MKSGKRTIVFDKGVYIASSGSVAGKKEAEGPLGNTFDEVIMDDLAGTDSWEKAESAFLKKAISMLTGRRTISAYCCQAT